MDRTFSALFLDALANDLRPILIVCIAAPVFTPAWMLVLRHRAESASCVVISALSLSLLQVVTFQLGFYGYIWLHAYHQLPKPDGFFQTATLPLLVYPLAIALPLVALVAVYVIPRFKRLYAQG
jgi:hypothetical protein